jgi:hypothetical protein
MLHVIALIIIVVMMAAVNSYNVYAQAPPSSGLSRLEGNLTNQTASHSEKSKLK